MGQIALSTLKTRARQKADMVNGNFIKDPELLNYINEAYFNFYDLIVRSFEDYNLLGPVSFSISSGSSTYSLPAAFYKVAGVDRSLGGGDYYGLERFEWSKRNSYNRSSYYLPSLRTKKLRYRITGNDLRIVPEQDAPGDYRLWYIPTPTALADDADEIMGYNGFEELIVIDTAIKMLTKEETDTASLMLERQRQEQRLEKMLIARDIGNVDVIEDVYSDYEFYDFDWG